MKTARRLLCMVLSLFFIFTLSSCGQKQSEKNIKIVVPAGSTEKFAYSDEEISPLKNKITIYSGEGLGDTEVVLEEVKVSKATEYKPTYLTHGMPVEMDVEKSGWYKIGVNIQNPTDEDITVYVTIDGVETRNNKSKNLTDNQNNVEPLGDGVIQFYNEPTAENKTVIVDKWATMTQEDLNLFLERIEKQKWVTDALVDRLTYYYDCRISYGDFIYIGYDQKVVYYKEHFTELTDENASLIKSYVNNKSENLMDDVDRITISIGETKYDFEDSKDIESICKLFEGIEGEKVSPNQEKVEGYYEIIFSTKEKEYSVILTGKTITYNGTEYYTTKDIIESLSEYLR